MEKELSQTLRWWRGSLIFTEGKAAKFKNTCLIFTNPYMGKIFKKRKAKMSNWVYLIYSQTVPVKKKSDY